MIKTLLKKMFRQKSSVVVNGTTTQDHALSNGQISANALSVVRQLQQAGFAAYLVGGCVRDLLLGLKPKDFDVATDAHPEQVRRVFRHSRIIGRRFKLVHVVFGRDMIEVSTFRKPAPHSNKERTHSEHGLVVRDNVYASAKEIYQDAIRRDFSVNALYYNAADNSILDFVDGMKDLQHKTLRIIGDPECRFQEDPVRLIRAVRLASKVDLHLDEHLIQAIPKTRHLLAHISPARLFDEVLKIILSGHAWRIFQALKEYHLLDFLMPEVHKALQQDPEHYGDAMIQLALKNTDTRLQEAKTINPAFMLAVWYWPVFLKQQQKSLQHHPEAIAFDMAAQKTLEIAVKHLHIPKRLTAVMRDIWYLQYRFEQPLQKRLCFSLLEHAKFRAGYDFLLIRAQAHAQDQALADWWQRFYEGDENCRLALLSEVTPVIKKRRRRKKPLEARS